MADRIEQLQQRIAEAKEKVAANLLPGDSKDNVGSSLFTTILGSKVGGFLSGTPTSAIEARKRQAEQELKRAEKAFNKEKGKHSHQDNETPAEKEEERREGEVRERDVIEKEDEVVDLLKDIKKNTGILVGDPSVIALVGAGGAGGGGAGGGGAGGGGAGLSWGDMGMIGAMLLPGPLKALAKSRVGLFVRGFFASTKIPAAARGTQLLLPFAQAAKTTRTASAVTGLSKAARVLSMGRFFGGLVSFGITEAIWQVGNAMIEEANDEMRASKVLLNQPMWQKNPQTGIVRSQAPATMRTDPRTGAPIPGTGMILQDPSVAPLPGENRTQQLKRGLLKENEVLVYEQLKQANAAFDANEDTIGVEHLKAARTLMQERGNLALGLHPRSLEEAMKILQFNPQWYGAAYSEIKGVGNNISSWIEPTDHGEYRRTLDMLQKFNPKTPWQFKKNIVDTGQFAEGTTPWMTNSATTNTLLRQLGFEGMQRTGGTGLEPIVSPRLRHGIEIEEQRKRGDLDVTPSPGLSMLPTPTTMNNLMVLDKNAARTFEQLMFVNGGAANVNLGMYNAPTVSVAQTQNYIAEGYNEDSFVDRERANLFNEANYNLRYT